MKYRFALSFLFAFCVLSSHSVGEEIDMTSFSESENSIRTSEGTSHTHNPQTQHSSIFDFSVPSIDGGEISLADYKGQVLLLVNVASNCGFTNQYEGLELLYQKYKERGLVVIGFPCNQFGNQEPGTEAEIKSFCSTTFNVTFPMSAKIDVNGERAHPLFQFLKSKSKGILGTESIKWNFTKFLVSRDGTEISRFAPTVAPEGLASDIERLL